MGRSKIQAAVLIAGALALAAMGSAQATMIVADNYVGSNDHGWDDRIGDERYEVHRLEVGFDGGYMNVRVVTNFAGSDPYGTVFGDLFISSDGWTMDEGAPYTGDDHSSGEDWEFVFDTSEGALFGGDFAITLAEDAPPAAGSTRYIVRDGQEVLRAGGGTQYEGSSVDLSNAETSIDYSILLASLGVAHGDEIGLKWGMSCANDTIEGAVSYSVPAPGTLALFGIGLLGFAFRRRA